MCANLLVQGHISIFQGPLLICASSQILWPNADNTARSFVHQSRESDRMFTFAFGKKRVSQEFHLNNGKTLTVSVSAEFYLQRHRCLEYSGPTRQDPRSPAGTAARSLHQLHLIN